MEKLWLKYVKVDSITLIPSFREPCRNGSINPLVEGLVEDFALESLWPSSSSVYIGHCISNSPQDVMAVSGVLSVMNEDEFHATWEQELVDRWGVIKQSVCNDEVNNTKAIIDTLKTTLPQDYVLLHACQALLGRESSSAFIAVLDTEGQGVMAKSNTLIDKSADVHLSIQLLKNKLESKLKLIENCSNKDELVQLLEGNYGFDN